MVDREGGVDLDAIADATQAVSPLLDAPPLDADTDYEGAGNPPPEERGNDDPAPGIP